MVKFSLIASHSSRASCHRLEQMQYSSEARHLTKWPWEALSGWIFLPESRLQEQNSRYLFYLIPTGRILSFLWCSSDLGIWKEFLRAYEDRPTTQLSAQRETLHPLKFILGVLDGMNPDAIRGNREFILKTPWNKHPTSQFQWTPSETDMQVSKCLLIQVLRKWTNSKSS